MLQTTRRKLKKWSIRFFWFVVAVLVICINYNRFYHNNFANYEKAVDYGRVREDKEIIRPVIAAVFYKTNQTNDKTLSGYLSHWDTNRIKTPKILIVPQTITPESQRVISKLYNEISKIAALKQISFICDSSVSLSEHNKLIEQHFSSANYNNLPILPEDASLAAKIQNLTDSEDSLVIVALDFGNPPTNNSLYEEIIYLAQQKSYKIRIFDEVDTQLAQALEENYASWFEAENDNKTTELMRQKNNLNEYKNHYQTDILKYFTANLKLSADENSILPEKTPQTYRLYDRGTVYIRFFGTAEKELFSRAKIGKNKGIIVAVIELARKAAIKVRQPIKSYKIYLLTELEKIEKNINIPLINYLETDDGVYVQYRRHKALMAPDERPNEETELISTLRSRAKIPDSATDSEIEFYRFKTAEITNEN